MINKAIDAKDKRSEILQKILTVQEKQVISLRFGIPNDNSRTLDQVGKSLGLTREGVRKIEQKALNKLRGHPSLKFLKNYLED